MSTENEILINSSLVYGYYKPDSSQFDSEGAGKSYDICDVLNSKLLDYRLKKISYILNDKQYIDKIKMEYINKKDGTSKTLETTTWEGLTDKMEEYELEDDEEINDIKIYLDNNTKLTGFEIMTNKGKNKLMGFGGDRETISEKNVKNVVGFGFNSSKKFGVYCIYFYYI